MNWTEIVTTIASVATALGVVFAALQIALTRRQARTQFEDGLAREYRELAQRIPVKALLGETIDDKDYANALDELYRYIDLSNEQVFLRQNNRISHKTWENWCDGIKSNLSKPAFKKAWAEIKSRATESFNELRRLEASGFKDDPRKWR
jgi:hypothetical protein